MGHMPAEKTRVVRTHLACAVPDRRGSDFRENLEAEWVLWRNVVEFDVKPGGLRRNNWPVPDYLDSTQILSTKISTQFPNELAVEGACEIYS